MAEPDPSSPELGCWVSPQPGGDDGEWLVAVEVLPPEGLNTRERPPLDLVLVVDRSSSMVGSRIAAAVEAARQICLRLNERDRVGVVAFDTHIHTVRKPDAATEETASEVAIALTELGVGYGTNISAGWKRAAEMISRGGIPGASKTVLVLTDGLPSRGLRKVGELEELVKTGAEQGIVTNTVGIGDRFDERVLSRMAIAGGGAFRFAEHDEDTVPVADEEVEGLKGLVAESAVLHVGFARAVKRYEVLHDLTCRSEGDGLAIELGRLFAVRPRSVLIQLVSSDGIRHLGAVGLSCVGGAGAWTEAGPTRILLPAPGQEESDIERVGASFLPLRVARWQQRIWECGRDASMSRLIEVMVDAQRELKKLPEELTRSAEAKEALARFERSCDRINAAMQNGDEGDAERRRQTEAAFKSMTEESTQTMLGVTRVGAGRGRRRRGWGKR
jgi:Ca-activated chloride channel family protein